MVNIPGTGGIANPGVFSSVETLTRGASIPGGTRILCIMGEGQRSEVIVSGALGSGKDGFNENYTSSSGSDGRHFTVSNPPLVSNRFKLYKNGTLLTGLEEEPDTTSTFSTDFDYRVGLTSGRIEMQTSRITDQGGLDYSAKTGNTGAGSIGSLVLTDENAPTETWTIKCVLVLRDNLNVPIPLTAKFIAIGSVSGVLRDTNGNPINWIANATVVTSSVLEFAITETSTFVEGDTFYIKTYGGVLVKNDTLTATYISELDIDDAEFFESMKTLQGKHGEASLENTLSLGAQLAFANNPPGVLAIQCAPPLPRRTSYVLDDSVVGETNPNSNDQDFQFPLPFGVTPDSNSDIQFFVTNPTTGVETQILPNKFEFYLLDEPLQPTTTAFINNNVLAPAGYKYSYTVSKGLKSLLFSTTATITRDATDYFKMSLAVSGKTFDDSYIGKKVNVIDSTHEVNESGTTPTLFEVLDVVSGNLVVTHGASSPYWPVFVVESGNVDWELFNNLGVSLATGTGEDLTTLVGDTIVLDSAQDFSVIAPTISLTSGHYVEITAAFNAANVGTWDIIALSGQNVVLRKQWRNDTAVQVNVVDDVTTDETDYIVLNKYVVNDGFALRVSIVDARDASFYDAGWLNALEKLEAEELDILVALPTKNYSNIFQNALAHCKSMSNIKNKKERVLFTGAIAGLSVDNVLGNDDVAVEDIGVLEGIQGDENSEILAGNTEDLANYSVPNAFGTTYRCVYFYPDEIVVQVGSSNQTLDGFYLAAAAGGYVSGTGNIAMPLTNKVMTGFTILRSKNFSPFIREQISAAGITLVQPVSGGGKVVWGKTTTQSGFVEEQEISIVFIRDRVAKSMRAAFEGFIGLPEDPTLLGSLTVRAVAALNSFVSQNLITAYNNLTVERDSVDPTQYNISVRVAPNYPVNFIFIKISVGLL